MEALCESSLANKMSYIYGFTLYMCVCVCVWYMFYSQDLKNYDSFLNDFQDAVKLLECNLLNLF